MSFRNGLDLSDIKSRRKNKIANERFEMISATNDAVFEVNLITGESWNNQAFDLLEVWEYFTKWENNSLIWRSRLHPDDRNSNTKSRGFLCWNF
jgi:hypothetical protein